MSRLADIFNSALSDRLSPTEQRDITRGFSILETTLKDLGSSIGAGGRGSRISSGSIVFSGDGLTLFNPSTGYRTVDLKPSGDFFVGYKITDPALTSLIVFSNDQYYNVETVGFGDVLLGDNSPGASNLFWDRSTGRLNFRGGTTVNTYIDTDGTIHATSGVFSGTITAGAGTIGGWTINPTTIQKSTIILDSSNDKITVGGTDVILDSSGITAIAGTIGGWTLAATSLSAPGVSINSAGTIVLGSSDIILDGVNARIDVGSAAGIVIDGGNNRIRSSNYASGVEGWQIKSDGSGEFGNLLVRGEIKSAVFTASEVQASGGTLAVLKRVGKLHVDFTTPVASDGIYIANDGGGATCSFANGEIVRIKTGATDFWGTLTAKNQQSEYASFTCTFAYGTTGAAVKAGQALIGYDGTAGGSIYLNASSDSVMGEPANLSIIDHEASPWSDETLQVRLGNLNGAYGATSDVYGVGIGDYSSGNYLSFNAHGTSKFIIAAGDGTVQIDENYISLLDKGGDPPRLTFREASTSTWYTQGRLYGENNDTHSTVWLVSRRDAGAPWDTYASTIISAYDSIVGASADVRMTINSTNIVAFSNVDYLRTDGGLSVGSLVNTPGVGEIISTAAMISLADGSSGGFYAGAGNDVHLYRSAANVWYTPDEFRSATILWALGDGSAYGIKIGTDGKIYRDTADSLYTSNKFTAERFTATLAGSSGGIFMGGDTQLYRSAANWIYTPDSMTIAGGLKVGTPDKTPTVGEIVADEFISDINGSTGGILFGDAQSSRIYWHNSNAMLYLTTRINTGGAIYLGYGDASNHDIRWYNGTTIMGDIVGDGWLRFNKSTAQNVYTNRYFRADGGLVAGSLIGASNDVSYRGNLRQYDGSTMRNVYALYPRQVDEIPHNYWYGTGKGNTSGAYYNVASTFSGVPSAAKAVMLAITIKSSVGQWVAMGVSSTYLNALTVYTQGTGYISNSAVVPVRTDGTIWIRSSTTGMEVWLRCTGYFV